MMDPIEFATAIKKKHPEYQDVDPNVLTRKILDKYPEYASQVQAPQTFEEEGVIPLGPLETIGSIGKLAASPYAQAAGATSEALGKAGVPAPISAAVGMIPAIGEMILPKSGGEVLGLAAGGQAAKGILAGGADVSSALASKFPNVAAAMKTAATLKIPLTAAEISQSPTMANVEGLLSRVPFASGIIKKFRQARMEKFSEARDVLVGKFGKNLEAETLGEATKEKVSAELQSSFQSKQEAIQKTRDELVKKYGPSVSTENMGLKLKELNQEESRVMKTKADRLYKLVHDSIPADKNVVPDVNLRQMAQKILDEELRIPSGTIKPQTTSTLKNILNGPQRQVAEEVDNLFLPADEFPKSMEEMLQRRPGYTFSEMNTIRSRLKIMEKQEDLALSMGMAGTKGMKSIEGGIYRRLSAAAEQDMTEFSDLLGGQPKQLHEVARSFYKEFKDIHNNKTIRTMLTKNPEDVYKAVVKPGDVTDIRALKRAVGEVGFRPVRQKFVEDLLGGKDAVPQSHEILDSLSKYSEETLRELLAPAQVNQLKAFAKTREMPQFIASEIEKRLGTIVKRTPQAVVNTIISGDATIARATRNMLGKKGFEPYRRKVLERIIGEAGSELFTGKKMASELADYEPEFLRVFFEPKELESINALAGLKGILETAERLGGNVSETGRTLLTAEAGLLIIKNPISAARILIAPPIAAKFYLSPIGRRLLTEGLTANERKMAALFPRMLAFYNTAKDDVLKEERQFRGAQQK